MLTAYNKYMENCMAIYHLHCGFVSRTAGRSVVQAAAYISGEKLYEERRGQCACYHKNSNKVVLVKTLAPDNSKYKDISVWNAIENFEDKYAEKHFKSEKTQENYKTSTQTGYTVVLALPNELSNQTNEELLDKFINTRFTDRGLITTYAIHQKEGNLHAHLLISRRAIGEDGDFLLKKDREICTKFSLCETRKLWANLANEFLEREGFHEKITEKSFEDLGINLEATKHRGWYADYIGTDSRLAQENLEIAKRNEEKILLDPSIVLDYLNEKKAVFTQRDILRFLNERVADDLKIPMIFEKVLNEAKYIGESIKGEFLYTGEKYQKLESDVLTSFDNLSIQKAQTHCKTEIVADVLSKYTYLSNEQKAAVQGLIKDDNFGILIGKAGAGKTTTMKAVAEIYKKSGARVIGMSLSAVASENLEKDTDIESATIASWEYKWSIYERAREEFLSFNSIVTEGVFKQLDWFGDLKRYESSQLKAGDIIIVDEAGMVGTKEWKTILKNAQKFGAKVIAVGDDNQFKPISSGDCFKQFQKQNNAFELNEIRRQKEDWQKQASVEFSKLNVGTALEMYDRHGKIHEVLNDIGKTIAIEYINAEQKGTVVVLCSTKKECSEINKAVRQIKKSRSELGNDIVKIGGNSFSKYDKIMFLENNKQFDVKNGQIGIVQAFEGGVLRVQTENGEKRIKTDEYDKIDHAYAITLHKSQGKTYDRTIVLANKFMDAKATYVAMSRHKEDVNLYYRKSDFSTFKALVNSASKYVNKDSLEDYTNIENQNRARVIEYRELQIEKAKILHDIKNGIASWNEYSELKQNSLSLGKEMLRNFDSYKLYLNQQGITREMLEIQCGERQRPLSKVEVLAKDTVELYTKTAQTTRSMFEAMKKENFNVTKNARYGEYCKIRDIRNGLAKEILANYPLHREFVNHKSKEYFISKKIMEKQVSYENATKINKENMFREFFKTIKNIDNSGANNTYKEYFGTSIDFIKARLNDDSYKLVLEMSEKKYGYKQYISQSMINHYILEHDLNIKRNDYMSKYASLLIQDKIDQKQEITPEMVVSSIKEVVCFEVLKEAAQKLNYEIQTEQSMNDLQAKAQVLANFISDKNAHILNDKTFMIRALKDLSTDSMKIQTSEKFININLQKEIQESLEMSHDKGHDLDIGI